MEIDSLSTEWNEQDNLIAEDSTKDIKIRIQDLRNKTVLRKYVGRGVNRDWLFAANPIHPIQISEYL